MNASRRPAEPAVVEIPPTRLNPTDATLWDIERNPTLRTTIVAAMVLDRPVRREHLLNVLEAASRRIPRLRQRVVANPAGVGAPHWEVDAEFDLAQHVSFVDDPDGIDDAAIASVAEPMASSPLDRDRPLWECTYLGGATGRSALLLKVHHSLTDGVGGIGLLDTMLDRRADAPLRDLDAIPIPRPGRRPPPTTEETELVVQRAVDAPFRVAGSAVAAAFHPLRAASDIWDGARSAGRLLAPSSDPLSPLLTGRGMDRRIGTSDHDLERLHRAAARHHCTINHAFFAGAIGGVAVYHRELGMPADGLRVTMPVSFRRSDHADAGNQWAPVRFVVPTDITDPVARMLAMRELVQASRRERALSFTQSLAGLVQVLPSALSSGVVSGMMHGIDMTLTNVPGLTEPHFLAGAAVERIYAFAPTAGAALNVAFMSHLDTACIGTLSDAAAVADPALLRSSIASGIEELVSVAERRPPTPPAAAPPPTATTDRLSALDTGFLRLETPETPLHVGAAFVLDGAPLREDDELRLDEIRRHVEARIRRLPRFTRRVLEVPLGAGRPIWVDDERFDIRRHVRVTDVAAPGDRDALLRRCTELLRDPLDRSRPLWELWFVDGMADGTVGIVEKVHHALIDGVSGVELAAALFDAEPVDVAETPVPRRPRPAPSGPRRLVDAVAEQLVDPVGTVGRMAATLWRSPGRAAERAADVAAAARELTRPETRAPRTPFNRPVGRDRVLRTVEVDLDEIHRVRRELGAKLNDVVLTAVAGAVRQWFVAEGEAPADVHVLVPVSTRHGSMEVEPGNHVGVMIVELPVGEPDPIRRLELVQDRMGRLKATHEGEGTAALLDALDHIPPIWQAALTRLIAGQSLVNFVVTNIPGPPVPLHLLGARIHEIIPVVPLGNRLGLGLAVLSYAGRLTISVSADPGACPDVDLLVAALEDEVSALSGRVPVS